MVKKISKIWFFQKFSNFSDMIWVVSGPAWDGCFTSIKVCPSHTNSWRKTKKTLQKLLFFACGAPFTEDGLENSNFRAVFFDFFEEFLCDEQPFIEVNQHPQAGPETTHTMCEKFENFWKNRIFEFFFDHFSCPPPHGLITDLKPDQKEGVCHIW